MDLVDKLPCLVLNDGSFMDENIRMMTPLGNAVNSAHERKERPRSSKEKRLR
jgi:hypothetical protein